MTRLIILLLFLLQFISCNKKVNEDDLFQNIKQFSGLEIQPQIIDSINYKYEISYRDDLTTYIIYLSDENLKKIFLKSQKLNGFEFYFHMDSISSFTKENRSEERRVGDNCRYQINADK